jgi:hypothetical protein
LNRIVVKVHQIFFKGVLSGRVAFNLSFLRLFAQDYLLKLGFEGVDLLLLLVEILFKACKLFIAESVFNVESQGKVLEGISAQLFVILTHVPEKRLLVAQVVIVFHLGVHADSV